MWVELPARAGYCFTMLLVVLTSSNIFLQNFLEVWSFVLPGFPGNNKHLKILGIFKKYVLNLAPWQCFSFWNK